MNPQVANAFTIFLYILIACILARSLITWFPMSRSHPIVKLLDQVTDPLIQPVRKILPSTGMIDFSGMVVIIVLYLMVAVVNEAAAR